LATLPAGCDPNEVDPEIVRTAYRKAIPITPISAVSLRIKYMGKV